MENSNFAPGMINPAAPAEVMTVKDWIIASIIVAIPLVGFVMLFVWAFGEGTNPNKANWAKASLLFMAVGVVFATLIFMLIGGVALLSGGNTL
ncbi:MAG: hypothetical protein ACNS60_01100 [Candidatus Cyclobacteriaceae bacterium M2_1C_046]